MEEIKKEYYNVEEVALILNWDIARVYYLIRTGVVAAEKKQRAPFSSMKVWHVSHEEVQRMKKLQKDI